MAQLPIQDSFGGTITFVDADPLGDSFANSGNNILVVRNKNINPRTITILSAGQCSFGLTGAAHNKTVEIPGDNGGSGSYQFLRLDPSRFNDGTGTTSVTYSNNGNGLAVAVIV
jgi:hypothetical protein